LQKKGLNKAIECLIHPGWYGKGERIEKERDDVKREWRTKSGHIGWWLAGGVIVEGGVISGSFQVALLCNFWIV
jgi:hypothetical protein